MTLALAVPLVAAAGESPATTDGVVVEGVQEGFAGGEAGLRPGDVLLGWERAASPPHNPEPAAGDLRSTFDLAQVEREQAPRGELTLRGTRDGAPLRVRVPPGEWKMGARPSLRPADLETYLQAKALAASGRLAEALPLWNQMALALAAAGDHVRASWLLLEVAAGAVRERSWDAAERAFAEASRAANASGDDSVVAVVQRARRRYFHDRSQWDAAGAVYGEALRAHLALASPSLGEAWIHNQLGRLAESRGDTAAAEEHHRRALAMREALAPGSADVAGSLLNLGNVARTRGDLVAADELYRRSLALYEALSLSAGIGFGLNNLGTVAAMRGDLRAAEDYLGRALAIEERLRPGTIEQAKALHNLGIVSRRRGDLMAADQHMTRALGIMEGLGPGLDAANLLGSLGVVYKDRGDLAGAKEYYERALVIREKLAPRSVELATLLYNLGNLAMARGDAAAAEENYRRAAEIHERLAPDSLGVASSLTALANTARKRGDLALARTHVVRSLSIAERIAPRGQSAEAALGVLGDIARDGGDLAAAQRFYERALDIQREMAPGQALEAEACQRLAALHRRRNDPEQALSFYRCSLAALDSQRRTLGGSDETSARFSQRFASYYRDTVEVLMELGRPAEAFHVLERYRARGLLSLLAERDLVFSADVPEELDRERRTANAEYERTLGRLAAAKATDAEKFREALARIRRRQAAVQERIRAASPRLADLEYPQPLDLAAAAATMDPGTVLLSYSLGDAKSYVFAVGPGPAEFMAVPLKVGLAALRSDVVRFRQLMQRPQLLQRKQLHVLARRLSDALLGPVSGPIGRADRLLVVPDGPLHLIPFAALSDPTSRRARRYLAEAKAVHVAASATVFAQQKQRRRGDREARLVAFGDPDYSAAGPANRAKDSAPALRSASERGLELRPLPASRVEVRGLEALYPGASRIYVGSDATEERAKAIGTQASLIHFATHALADEMSPLDSTLALSLPAGPRAGGDNGLLQAWEIFEQLRIDAELVTLSACGTALGKEMSGEGILGLTRAFQYAGARSVLASLWEVSDDWTADLMKRFYRYLKQGRSKDSALRAAQIDMIRRPASSHPHRWAAFQLVGDWQ